jgi:hypothetical protein
MAAETYLIYIAEQGEEARELGLTEADCPYLDGENRDAWLAGLNGKPVKKGGKIVADAKVADA